MNQLIEGVLRFQREVYPQSKDRYRELALGQTPAAMFIGCSDSRTVPELLTQQEPGELFVVRNAGNIVPPGGPEPGGVTASIEFGVAVLQVPDIVICGHSGCGAMTAILRGPEKVEALPAVARWLHYADAAREVVASRFAEAPLEERLTALIQQNVLAQLENLMTHRVVADAVHAGKLRLHGWVHDIGSGGVNTYDAHSGQFVPIAEGVEADATPVE